MIESGENQPGRRANGVSPGNDKPNDDIDSSTDVFAHLCRQWERLNDFRVSLMKGGAFADVGWQSYIRQFRDGWMVEGHVEAALPSINQLRCIWSIELYEADDKLQISTVVKVYGTDFFKELDTRTAVTSDEFGRQLEAAVTELIGTYEVGSEFRRCIDSAR